MILSHTLCCTKLTGVCVARQGKDIAVMKGEGVAAKEAGFLLKQLQDSSASAMAEIFGGTAPRTRSVSHCLSCA
jgi:hypothetical protein